MYIATDISMEGLQLNRSRNPFGNSVYVVCSVGSLPFLRNSIDLLCYFGVLHHTQGKSRAILNDAKVLKSDGYIMLHEPLKRPAILKYILKNEEESLHEGRVIEKNLFDDLNNIRELKIIALKEMNTIIMSGFLRFFQGCILREKSRYHFMVRIDAFFMKILRKICPYFKPAEILMLLKKVESS